MKLSSYRGLTGLVAMSLAAGCLLQANTPATPTGGNDLEKELAELMNTTVTGASKRAQRLVESPQAIEVLTAEDIRQQGIYRLQDALKLMTSIDVLEIDNGYSVIGMRGIMQEGQPRTVQILVDGVPLYQPMGGPVDINNIPVPVDLIERVEVVRGPSSTLYGANAVAGVIAITTKKLEDGAHGAARFSAATLETRRGSANMSWNGGGFGVVAGYSGSSLGTTGETTRATMGGTWQNVKYDDAYSNASHQYQNYARGEFADESTRLTLSVGEARKVLGRSLLISPYKAYEVRTALLGWQQTWSKDFSTEFRVHRMTSSLYLPKSNVLFAALGDPKFLEGEYRWANATVTQAEVQANWTATDRVRFVFGADTRKSDIDACQFEGLPNPAAYTASGAFASMDVTLPGNLVISGGARTENEALGGSRRSPRLTAVWTPVETSIFRFGYYTSTRSPQVLESRINFARPVAAGTVYQIRGNASLKPEKTFNLELGYRQIVGPFTFDLTLYQMRMSDAIIQASLAPTTTGGITYLPTQFQNQGDSKNKGIEFATTWLVTKGWTVGANASFLSYSKNVVTPADEATGLGDRYAYAPKTKFNLWNRYQVGPVTIFAAWQYVSPVDMEILQTSWYPAYEKRPEVSQWHLNASWEIIKGLSLGAYVRNGAKEFTIMGAAGPDRPTEIQSARREIGGTLSFRF